MSQYNFVYHVSIMHDLSILFTDSAASRYFEYDF